jgi:hypothetical protein
MEPAITLYLVGTALAIGIRKARDWSAARDVQSDAGAKTNGASKSKNGSNGARVADAREFKPEQTAVFTHNEGGQLVFDADVCARLPEALCARSAVQLAWSDVVPPDKPELADELELHGRAFRIVPFDPAVELASACLARLQRESPVVLASLSVIMLPTGADDAVLLIAGDARMARYAGPQGQFAIVPRPTIEATGEPAEQGENTGARASAPQPEPEPSSPAASNGLGQATGV